MFSMASRGIAPGRSRTGRSFSKPTMVDSSPSRRGSAVENQFDLTQKSFGDVFRRSRAHLARRIGARRGDGHPGGCQEALRDRLRRHADRDRVEARAHQIAETRIRLARQHQRQCARPEPFGEIARRTRKFRQRFRVSDIAHMDDQGIETRPAFGREDRGDCPAVAGIRAQPVDGLGGKRDEPATAQNFRRRGDRRRIGRPDIAGGRAHRRKCSRRMAQKSMSSPASRA